MRKVSLSRTFVVGGGIVARDGLSADFAPSSEIARTLAVRIS